MSLSEGGFKLGLIVLCIIFAIGSILWASWNTRKDVRNIEKNWEDWTTDYNKARTSEERRRLVLRAYYMRYGYWPMEILDMEDTADTKERLRILEHEMIIREGQ